MTDTNRRLRIYAIDRQTLMCYLEDKDIDDVSALKQFRELTGFLERVLGTRIPDYADNEQDIDKEANWSIVAYQYNITYHSIDVLVKSYEFEIIPELQLIPRYNATR